MEAREEYAIAPRNGQQVAIRANGQLAEYTEDEMGKIIAVMYPGADAVAQRGAVLLGMRYKLDPIMREVMVIKFRGQDQNGRWTEQYAPYIGRRGMERIANRSGVKWSINMRQPKLATSPYTREEDVYLEADLIRTGYPPLRWGLWLSEVALMDKEGNFLATWKTKRALMHQKAVEKHLLERAFSVSVPGLPANAIVIDGEGDDLLFEDNDELVPAVEMSAKEAIDWITTKARELYQAGVQDEDLSEETHTWLQTHLLPFVGPDKLAPFIKATCQNADGISEYFGQAFIEGMRDGPLSAETIQKSKDTIDENGELEVTVDPEKAKQDAADLFGGDEPKKEPPPQPKKNGRPYDLAGLKNALNHKAADYHASSDNFKKKADEGFRGAITGSLNKLCGDDERRHTLLRLLFDSDSMKDRTHGEVKALSDWMDKDEDMAREEAQRIINAEIGNGHTGQLL